MKINKHIFLLTLFIISQIYICLADFKKDTTQVNSFLKKATDIYYTDPNQTLKYANEALALSVKINYKEGEAEAFRMKGAGFKGLEKRDSAIIYYFKALNHYKTLHYQQGELKSLNSIGNLYNNYSYDKALYYYAKTLNLAKKLKNKDIVAGSIINIGTIYFRKKKYTVALKYFNYGYQQFKKLKDDVGTTLSLVNMGVIYFRLNEIDKAESMLLEAHQSAKNKEMYSIIATLNLTLSDIAIKKDEYQKAEEYIKEGIAYSKLYNSDKSLYDYTLTSYELEAKRKNYKKALEYLEEVHKQDDIDYKKSINDVFKLSEEQSKQLQIQKENELTIEKQKRTQTLFLATVVVTILAFFVIFLLMRSKRITEKNNKKLQSLNDEVSLQKENVDKINLQLEEIIAQRTKDLINKNQKLSEYSSHLSHQIRGPVATLKGLIMLSQDNLIEEKECIGQMRKCVDDIDEKIMDINIALHDPERSGLG